MLMIGSVQNYVKSLELKNKWELKKKGVTEPAAPGSITKKEVEDQQKGMILSSINAKLQSGQKLSSDEMKYLQANSPDMYQKAVKIAQEREQYKQALKKCKTKEDVEDLHNQKLQQFTSEAGAIGRSNMDKGAKIAAMGFLQMRMAGVQDEHITFLSSEEYAKLPHRDEKKGKRRQVDVVLLAAQKEQAAQLKNKDPLDKLLEEKEETPFSPEKEQGVSDGSDSSSEETSAAFGETVSGSLAKPTPETGAVPKPSEPAASNGAAAQKPVFPLSPTSGVSQWIRHI